MQVSLLRKSNALKYSYPVRPSSCVFKGAVRLQLTTTVPLGLGNVVLMRRLRVWRRNNRTNVLSTKRVNKER